MAFSVGDEDGVVVRAGEDGHVAGTGSGLDEPGAEAGRGVLHQEEVLVARPAPGQEDGLSPQGPAPDGVEEGGGLGVAVAGGIAMALPVVHGEHVSVEGMDDGQFLLPVSVDVAHRHVRGGLLQQLLHRPVLSGGGGGRDAEDPLVAGGIGLVISLPEPRLLPGGPGGI